MNRGRLVDQGTGRVFPLGFEPITIGRQVGCGIVLPDLGVSRHHAEIAMQGGKWVVRDLGSANGTYVNGQRLTTLYVLDHGDTIRVGGITLQVEIPTAIARRDTLVEGQLVVTAPPARSGLRWGVLGLGLAAAVMILVLLAALVVWPWIRDGRIIALPSGRPKVTLVAPAGGARVTVGTPLDIQAEATSSRGVLQVRILVDGLLVQEMSGGPDVTVMEVGATWMPERAGTHAISAVAQDTAGEESAAVVVNVVAVEAVQPTLQATDTAVPTAPTAPQPSPEPPTAEPTVPPPTVTDTPVATDTPEPKPAIGYFRADRTAIERGQCARLEWGDVAGAHTITLTGVGRVGAEGKLDVCLDATKTYTLEATGVGGRAEASIQIAVQPPSGLIIEYFRVVPSIISPGDCAQLEWGKVDNATSAAIEPGIGGVGTPGSLEVCPGGTTTYVLTAQRPDDSRTARVTLIVSSETVPKPVIAFFTASPGSIGVGECTTLSWGKVDYAAAVTIDQGIGGVGTPGSKEVCLGATTTFVMTAVGAGGTTEQNLVVTVSAEQPANLPDLVVKSILFEPNPCYRGQSCQVRITVRNDGPVGAGRFVLRWAPAGEEAVPVEWDLDSLDAGQERVLKYTWIPDRAADDWRTLATVDAWDDVEEINEGKANTLAQFITVLEP